MRVPFSQYTGVLVYREKGTLPKSKGGRVLMLQNYLPPLRLKAEALISSPLPLTLEPSTHDHHLLFNLFSLNPLNKKVNIIQYVKYFLLF